MCLTTLKTDIKRNKDIVLTSMFWILISVTLMVLVSLLGFSQVKDNQSTFKKRVLETTEVDFLMSYYEQSGTHASVTGGIGNEKLSDIAPTIILAIPLSDDNIFTIDAGISAYSSASSSNLDPFDSSGASGVIMTTMTTMMMMDYLMRLLVVLGLNLRELREKMFGQQLMPVIATVQMIEIRFGLQISVLPQNMIIRLLDLVVVLRNYLIKKILN